MDTSYVKLSIWLIILTALFQIHGCESCSKKEKAALLEIKAFFISIANIQRATDVLSSWVDDIISDCCDWERLKCNATTQRVIELNLTMVKLHFYDSLDGYPQLNLSLFTAFEELRTLNLFENYFEGFYMNSGSYNFGSLKKLEILNLGGNYFNDSILPYLTSLTSLKILILQGNHMVEVFKSKQGLCELKNLVEVDLSENYINGPLPYCLSNLTNLKFLDLSHNQLNGKLLPSTIPNLPSIEYLSLRENNFEGLFSFNSLANFSKLQIFQLSSSLLRIETEEFPRHLQLKALSLYNCSLQAIPKFLLHQSNLQLIDLSHNMLFGDFPTWLLQNNTNLQILCIHNNSFSGILHLPKSQHGLLYLHVSKNYFAGQLPVNIGMILPLVMDFIISENHFEGSIPLSMGEMKSLRSLDMSNNNFSGELPKELVTGCISLLSLSLSHNNFQGQIFPKYMELIELRFLYLDNNYFDEKMQDGLSKATSLSVLDISNNMLSGEIPDWIGNFSFLEVFSISNNLLEGNIPIQLSNLKFLRILDISENRLSGSMTSSLNFSSLEHLYMHKNAFNGSIPNALQRSSRLVTLDLRDNQFFGDIPHWIDELSRLRILLLRGNQLQGYISNHLCQLKDLSILDLSYNKFNGSIPSCFTNMTLWMQQKYDDSPFSFTDKMVWSLGMFIINYSFNSFLDFKFWREIHRQSGQRGVEFMTKNRYESYGGNILNYMTGLDLSSNELTGDIPSEIGNLQHIHALNLSHNYLSGSIPKSFSNLKNIESLDLSNNKLSGRIPPQLTELYTLAIFNVSYNNLSGPIPNAWQFGSFSESNYAGNPNLCGPTIRKNCSDIIVKTTTPLVGSKENESVIDMVAFYWSFVVSGVTIMLGLFVILWLNSDWCRLWFCFVDACVDLCFYWIFKYV